MLLVFLPKDSILRCFALKAEPILRLGTTKVEKDVVLGG